MALFRLDARPGDGDPDQAASSCAGKMEDFEPWARLRDRSRDFLAPWEPIWPADDLTRGAFRRRLRRHADEMVRDEAYPLLVFPRPRPGAGGGLTLEPDPPRRRRRPPSATGWA